MRVGVYGDSNVFYKIEFVTCQCAIHTTTVNEEDEHVSKSTCNASTNLVFVSNHTDEFAAC